MTHTSLSKHRTTSFPTHTLESDDARLPMAKGALVNDVHSQLNLTAVRAIVRPRSIAELQATVRQAAVEGCAISIAGGRHAMGGQQFGDNTVLVDMRGMNRVLGFDAEHKTVDAEAGVYWTELITELRATQKESKQQLSIIQKQTGADCLSLGGALAANIHGRGLRLKPIIGDVESFVLVDATGAAYTCSRTENNDLFRLAIGGYGLFGIITNVRLRLAPRRKLQRKVEITTLEDVARRYAAHGTGDFLYGDFQFMTDEKAEGFLRTGVLSCYSPVPDDTPLCDEMRELSAADWSHLLYLAHADRARAFSLYAQHYLATHNQVYQSDTHQLSTYLDGYHRDLDELCGAQVKGTEMISEVYVPRCSLLSFMESVREDFRRYRTELIYGTIRLIEPDDESFLAWAREDYACIVFNLHVNHDAAGIEKARRDFRRLINRAIEHGGNYYLTYHRWATREQVERCYPQFQEFMRLKKIYDPRERFQSDWYRHHALMFGESIACGAGNSERSFEDRQFATPPLN